MTMRFRLLKKSIIENVLGPAEYGRFKTIGYQRQGIAGSEVQDNNRLVQLYFQEGDFSKAGGRQTGPTQHDITFKIEATVSKASEGDIAAILDSGSSAAKVATALYNFQEASALADESLDELLDILYQTLMHGENLTLGLAENTVSNRWISGMTKDNPVPRGELVVMSGAIMLSCRVCEELLGAEGVAGGTFEVDINNIGGDEEQKTEVAGNLGG